jgi:hypothetical protein
MPVSLRFFGCGSLPIQVQSLSQRSGQLGDSNFGAESFLHSNCLRFAGQVSIRSSSTCSEAASWSGSGRNLNNVADAPKINPGSRR